MSRARTFTDYIDAASELSGQRPFGACRAYQLRHYVLDLACSAADASEHAQAWIRSSAGADKDRLMDAMGACLFHLVELANELGISLEAIAFVDLAARQAGQRREIIEPINSRPNRVSGGAEAADAVHPANRGAPR